MSGRVKCVCSKKHLIYLIHIHAEVVICSFDTRGACRGEATSVLIWMSLHVHVELRTMHPNLQRAVSNAETSIKTRPCARCRQSDGVCVDVKEMRELEVHSVDGHA